MSLRPYQVEALEAIRSSLVKGVWSQVLVLPTGSGKTVCFAHLPMALEGAVPSGRMLILAHREELLQQAAEKLRAYNPHLMVAVEQGDSRAGPFHDVVVASIQTLAAAGYRRLQLLRREDFRIIVVDEAHHTPAATYQRILGHFGLLPPVELRPKKGASDGEFLHAREACRQWWQFQPNDRLLLGVTATPSRADGIGLEWSYQTVVYQASLRNMIEQGYLVPPRGMVVDTRTNLDDVHTVAGDFKQDELAKTVNTPERNRMAVAAWKTRARNRFGLVRPTLAFTVDIEHARDVAATFQAAGVNADWASGDRREPVAAFKIGAIDVLASCNLVTEGFDHPPSGIALMLRPTKSHTLYAQCLDHKTEVLTEDGWRGIDDQLPANVAAFDLTDGSVRWVSHERIERLLGDESMYGIESPHLSIRVTAGHRMVGRRRAGSLEFRRADALPAYWRIPVCGDSVVAEANITDDEVAFLGLLLTDGHFNKKNRSIALYQSDANPGVIELIERTIHNCGFKCGHSVEIRPSNYGPRMPLHRWTISHGAPRGRDKHLSGWSRLAPWISDGKSLTSAFEDLSSRQVGLLIAAMHAGNGNKHVSPEWTSRTLNITVANYRLADQIQSLLVRRGYRCNMVPQSVSAMLHVSSDRSEWSVVTQAADGRPVWAEVPAEQSERVWCVTVETGAIIIRRQGKVSIVGNCIGRVLRLAEQKYDALILDVVDVTKRHSLVSASDLFGLPEKFNAEGQALLSAVQRIEAIQQRLPGADFSTVSSVSDIERRLAKIDLWQVRESPMVTQYATLSWVMDSNTVYHLGLPRRGGDDGEGALYHSGDRITLRQNMLGEWAAIFTDGDTRVDAQIASAADVAGIFRSAEQWIAQVRPDVASFKRRDASWRVRKASPKQIARLKKLGATLNYQTLTRGAASALLDQYHAAKELSGVRR